jgi:hypothetical protein
MKNIDFRTLRADEIEVRPSHVKDGKANLLLYIDSRAVVSLLNESVGNLNWQSRFYEAHGQMMGEIGIYDDERDVWIWKGDTGSESNIEASKGLISDVYKRALSRWGVDELYTSPRIQVEDDGYGNTGYKVSEIEYNEHREICHLVIVNRFGKEVYRMNPDCEPVQAKTPIRQPIQTLDNREVIIQSIKDAANKEFLKGGVNETELRKFVAFYTKKVENGGWKGDFHFDSLFTNWMSRVRM